MKKQIRVITIENSHLQQKQINILHVVVNQLCIVHLIAIRIIDY